MKNKTFIKGVEKLVNPIEVGSIHVFQGFAGKMPIKLQKRFMMAAEKKAPYLGFIVEPHSLFMCFEIRNKEEAEKLLPENFSLVQTTVHEDDTPSFYGIVGSFNAHTSGFWGAREETYVIAKDNNTGLVSWVMIDISTNTISFEPKKGLQNPNADNMFVTQDHGGNILVDLQRNDATKELSLACSTSNAHWVNLSEQLWLEGNLSVAYGNNIGEKTTKPFSLIFDPQEVSRGLCIPINDLNIETNTLVPNFFAEKPKQIISFPFSQHFLSDSPNTPKLIRNKEELLKKYTEVKDLSAYQAMSLKGLFAGILGLLLIMGIATLGSILLAITALLY